MDYNADGINDMIAGSFDGTIYLSLGDASGFTAWTRLQDENGDLIRLGVYYAESYVPSDPMPFAPEDTAYHHTQSERCILIDWEGDGDLDLVMGSDSGSLFLRRNIGTRAEPVYAALNEVPRTSNGQPFGTGSQHASFSYADFDGDGKNDLITGGMSGGAVWYRNVSEDNMSEPVFAPAETLLGEGGSACKLSPTLPFSTAVDAFDYNGDGKVDLVVGDISGAVWVYHQQ